ncbi:DinB family protein [Carboxydochorda subterranea]|uniref:DinB family protein n=1 Tax=Carboxydichorda subterranea TaxID=3109565 RepID=A0ABZ1C1F4_9FIRM|nr:DinB family protein [Limnochorda sp. L945t]WRP18695.1 DinB family protein [Limnochorda sp. L945t]
MTTNVSTERLTRAVLALLDEAFAGPKGDQSWFTDRGPRAGLLGFLDGISHEAASTPPGPGRATIVAHANHVRFGLNLANRWFGGEDAYASVDWAKSWAIQSLDAAGWQQLRQELRREYEDLRQSAASAGKWVDNDVALTGILAHIAHAAYHLGAIRQIARSVMP